MLYRFKSRIRIFARKRTRVGTTGSPGFEKVDSISDASGGMGDGFGIGASKTAEAATPCKCKFWRDTLDDASGGMGDGLGIGASRIRDVRVLSGSRDRCCNVDAEASGGTGEGFGIGASKAALPPIRPYSGLAGKVFRHLAVLAVRLFGEIEALAPCEVIPTTANARVITDKFILINY